MINHSIADSWKRFKGQLYLFIEKIYKIDLLKESSGFESIT